MEEDFEDNSHDSIEVLPQHIARGTEENHLKPQSGWLVYQMRFKLQAS
jgi:hypothetical protein